MNLYFLVEGEKTETALYPKWLSYLVPELTQVERFEDVASHNFYLFSGEGIPSIFNHLVNAVQDINSFGKYDYLVLCLDSEELTIEETKQLVNEKLETVNIKLEADCKLEIIVQHPTIETWLLGNRKVFKRNPQGRLLREFIAFYNVMKEDSELMEKLPQYPTKAFFHEKYLREMLKEYNIRYKKSRPEVVLEKSYFEELQKRVAETPNHLKSLQSFFRFCEMIRSKL